MATEDARSSEECQALCASNPSCTYFTFFGENNGCHLKGDAAIAGRMKNDSAISGPVSCHIPDDSKIGENSNSPTFLPFKPNLLG